MISLKTLSNKYRVEKAFSTDPGDNDVFPDLTRSSINKIKWRKVGSTGKYRLTEEDKMRPDLISNVLYGDQSKFDLLLKYNAISNPFSLDVGYVLLTPDMTSMDAAVKKPVPINDIGNVKIDETEAIFINPKTSKDKKRLEMLKKQVKGKEILPSNINKKDAKNVKIRDGKLIFGEDVTSINKDNCPEPISRANLKKALIQNNLFG